MELRDKDLQHALQHGLCLTGWSLARRRLDQRVSIDVADLGQPLTMCADESFDIVAASLVLHYLEHWEPPLAELRRVLVPGGVLAISTHHPTMDWPLSGGGYFEMRQITETWHKGDTAGTVTFWRRPLTAMVASIRSTGFVIDDIVEPMPAAECEARFPDAYVTLTTAPRFLFFRLQKLASSVTASASLMEPSMRYATERRCARSASNRSPKNWL